MFSSSLICYIFSVQISLSVFCSFIVVTMLHTHTKKQVKLQFYTHYQEHRLRACENSVLGKVLEVRWMKEQQAGKKS
jgi:hypothetical protein